jgi:hypothetical protein
VANHFKWLANTFPVTFLFVGVGLERRDLIREGLAAGEAELAQNARRWTTLVLRPFEITAEAGRRTWRQLLLAIEKDLVLAGAHPGMVADDLADYLFARPPGMRRTPRWWRQLSASRYCPRCLAANGGRWMLAWRIPWTFACVISSC